MVANLPTRTKRIEEALAATKMAPLRVQWRGKREEMPVIKVELSTVVLNPRSHRIKAQLESDPDARALVDADPESEQAQEAIKNLLRLTPRFEELKENLRADEQKEPGIATREGLLVNANTRAAALEDLGEKYIEVAVLPPDATLSEIYDLELDLQVAETYQQEYSFTNELLFIEDLITEQNRDEKQVAEQLRWITPTKQSTKKKGIEQVRRYVRHLDLIREIQEMSGGKVPLTDFDDAEQTLREFDASYEALRAKDPKAATRLKYARTLGLLVDLGYERQRMVDEKWVESYFAEALAEQEVLRDAVPLLGENGAGGASPVESPADGEDPFADFDGEGEEGEGADIHLAIQDLVRRLGESAREEVISLPTPDGEREYDRTAIQDALNEAMRMAAEDAKNAAKAGNALKLPAHHVEEAVKRLTRARRAYADVHERADFDAGPLHAELEKAKRALDALEETVVD
jgi:hypothetical protein